MLKIIGLGLLPLGLFQEDRVVLHINSTFIPRFIMCSSNLKRLYCYVSAQILHPSEQDWHTLNVCSVESTSPESLPSDT